MGCHAVYLLYLFIKIDGFFALLCGSDAQRTCQIIPLVLYTPPCSLRGNEKAYFITVLLIDWMAYMIFLALSRVDLLRVGWRGGF